MCFKGGGLWFVCVRVCVMPLWQKPTFSCAPSLALACEHLDIGPKKNFCCVVGWGGVESQTLWT